MNRAREHIRRSTLPFLVARFATAVACPLSAPQSDKTHPIIISAVMNHSFHRLTLRNGYGENALHS
ncbi:Uncharacterised protein [Vibrio cholerae]|nr:Uncharacterised protein [Vibrio cholerae]